MKIIAIFLFNAIFVFQLHAQNKSETIKVWGNCGMCKKTIEAAAVKGGASKASWNEDSKVLSVSYNAKKTSNQKIQEAVAASGYDTQDLIAPNDSYSKLSPCCQYDRKVSINEAAIPAKDDCKESGCCKDGKCTKEVDCCKDQEKCKACCKK